MARRSRSVTNPIHGNTITMNVACRTVEQRTRLQKRLQKLRNINACRSGADYLDKLLREALDATEVKG